MENMKKISEMLTASIFEVFEKMFFTFLEPEDEDVDAWGYNMVAGIEFTGPHKGAMQIYLMDGLAETLVANMLNIGADEVSEAYIMDITKEAMNMICGNFLRKLDISKVFDLTIPAFERSSGNFSLKDAGGEEAIRLVFDSDGDKMGVVIKFLS